MLWLMVIYRLGSTAALVDPKNLGFLEGKFRAAKNFCPGIETSVIIQQFSITITMAEDV